MFQQFDVHCFSLVCLASSTFKIFGIIIFQNRMAIQVTLFFFNSNAAVLMMVQLNWFIRIVVITSLLLNTHVVSATQRLSSNSSKLNNTKADNKKPNFLIILADDLGYSDISSFGSEIDTPGIDSLAKSGVKFSNFHVAATCSPTRSMLLTGVDNHLNGLGNMRIIMDDNQFGQPGYEGELNTRVETVSTILQRNGYSTYLSGKWHLGMQTDNLPVNRGFDQSISLMETGADNWEKKPYLPHNKNVHYFDNANEIDLPEDFYSSDFYTDNIMGYLQQRDPKKPFFAYLAFTAVHYPHQAPKALTEKYLANYQDGWDVIKSKRYARLVQLGLMPPGLEALQLPTVEQWSSLSKKDQAYRTKQMAVYAAMVKRMDYNIERLLSYLKQTDLFDNTVIMFMSDNGADNNEIEKIFPDYIQKNFTTDIETLGEKGSYANYGPSWANVSMTPLSWYKGSASEGGMRSPLIVHYPKQLQQGVVTHSFSYITDIVPTILDLAGLTDAVDKNKASIMGRSQVGVLTGVNETVYAEKGVIAYELAGSAALFKGDYKLVRNFPPFGDKQWRLFNIKTDPVERYDLATTQPKHFKEMLLDYQVYQSKVNMVEVTDDYNVIKQLGKNLKRIKDHQH
jgi:arylsulfatase A-like enzyme